MKNKPFGVVLLIILCVCSIFSNVKYLISDNLFIYKVFTSIGILLTSITCVGLWNLKDWARKLFVAYSMIFIIWMGFWFFPLFKNKRIENWQEKKTAYLEKIAQNYDQESSNISKTERLARASKTYDWMQSDAGSINLFFVFSFLISLIIFYLTRAKIKEQFK